MWFAHSECPLAPKQREMNCLLQLDLARTPTAAHLSPLCWLLTRTLISSFVLMSG